ncbi:hypothetical protein DYB35_005153 [Aphanomyces astaci]|uniref:Uncharacterized protein n=1 Tax=Aphanomyces astaci TaxID=112090 RepID=A0A418DKV4_APHAT|nr:hypothetical protein DYB35_005153 [Aphanomyces astaci]
MEMKSMDQDDDLNMAQRLAHACVTLLANKHVRISVPIKQSSQNALVDTTVHTVAATFIQAAVKGFLAVVAPDLLICAIDYSDDIAAVRPLDEPGGVGDFNNVSNARIDDVLPEASPVSSSSSGRLLHQYSQSSFICDTTASPPPTNDLDVQDMLALGLSFESFMEAFESAYDDIGVAAAADALRVLAHEDGKWKTKAALHQVATLMQAKACDPDIWTEEVNACCMWLLKELLAN